MSDPRLQNMLGAVAMALTDLIEDGMARADSSDVPAEAVALIGRSPGRSIQELSTDVRLSHAATLRMVGRLVDAGIARRGPSPSDRRVVRLWLTPLGKRAYARLLSARRERLSGVLEALSPTELQALARIADKLLAAVADAGAATSRLCRFCDVGSCERCPIDGWRETRPSDPHGAASAS